LSTTFILYISIILREQHKTQTAVYVILFVLILGTFSVFKHFTDDIFEDYVDINGPRGGVVVKALRYKPAGRGFDSR
jgi:hypothetical protein